MTDAVDLGIPGLEVGVLVGRGVGAAVYRCYQPALNREVAIKVFAATATAAELERFANESRTLGQFHWCPQIVTVFHAGVSELGAPYLCMEYFDGGNLDDRLRRSGALSDGELTVLGVDLASALQAAHAAGVLHRDVKPANVLISRSGRFVLGDFGVARGLTEWSHETSSMAGTIAFAAPEIINGDPASVASDIYAVGATLFAARAGHGPHVVAGHRSPRSQMSRALQGLTPDLSALDLPPESIAVFERCLAGDPAARFPDADSLLAAVTALRDVEVAPAPPRGPASSSGAPWPTAHEYVEAALEAPHLALASVSELADARLALGRDGRPVAVTGEHAVVFRIDSAVGPLALRCFTREGADRADRYQQLRDFLENTPMSTVVPARWLDESLSVRERRWPAVLMPWVAGLPLDEAVARRLGRGETLTHLADSWLSLAQDLHRIGLAHGDLQCSNVLVDDRGNIRLVDLDACYVPGMTVPPQELGHPDFQHPSRNAEHWGPDIDAFSVLVGYLGLRALSVHPALWSFRDGDGLLLDARHYVVGGQAVPAYLLEHADAEIRRLADLLRDCLSVDYPPQAEFVLAQLRTPPVQPLPAGVPGHHEHQASSVPDVGPSRPVAPVPESTTLKAVRRPAVHASPRAGASVSGPTDPAPWWQDLDLEPDPLDAVGERAAIVRSPRSRLHFLRSALVSGISAGILSALLGCGIYVLVARELFGPELRGSFFVALVGALMTSTLASFDSVVRRAWRRTARTASLGLVAGAAVTLVGLGVFQLAISGTDLTGPEAPLWFAAGVWVVTGVSAGIAIGLSKASLRVTVSGAMGGLLAGLLGGLVFYSSGPRLTNNDTGRWLLYLNFSQVTTTVAVVAACTLLGLGIGVAERLSRRSWLRVIEGTSAGVEIPLDRRGATIGTGRADLRLAASDALLVEHARVRTSGDGFVLTALGEVELNGTPVPPGSPLPLRPADVLRVSGSFIRFESLVR